MTAAYADIAAAPRSLPSLREAGLWAGAALVVVLAHAAIGYGVNAFQPSGPPPASEPALMIDLTPLAISTPEAIEAETITNEKPEEVVQPIDTTEIARNALNTETIKAETPEIVEPETTEVVKPEVLPEPVAPEPVKPEATAEAVEPEKPEPEVAEPVPVEPELTAPEVAPVVTPEVVLAVPQPRPVVEAEPEPRAEKPRKAETKKATKTEKAEKAEKKAAEKKQVAKAEAAPAPKSKASVESRGSASKASATNWRSRIQAWLARHKPRRVPAQGTVNVTFAVNTSGAVTSVRITRSSGDPELDQAALNMVRRASPVPAPDRPQTVTLPLAFVRK